MVVLCWIWSLGSSVERAKNNKGDKWVKSLMASLVDSRSGGLLLLLVASKQDPQLPSAPLPNAREKRRQRRGSRDLRAWREVQ